MFMDYALFIIHDPHVTNEIRKSFTRCVPFHRFMNGSLSAAPSSSNYFHICNSDLCVAWSEQWSSMIYITVQCPLNKLFVVRLFSRMFPM